jgi:hypothetical protein
MPYVQPEPEKPRGEGGAGDRARISQAVKDYYEAVGRENWAYTYDNLDSQTRAMFTEEEWRSRTKVREQRGARACLNGRGRG